MMDVMQMIERAEKSSGGKFEEPQRTMLILLMESAVRIGYNAAVSEHLAGKKLEHKPTKNLADALTKISSIEKQEAEKKAKERSYIG